MNGNTLKQFWRRIESLRIHTIRLLFFFQRSKYLHVGHGIEIYGKFVCHSPGNVEIGSGVSINDHVYINGAGGVKIGNNVALSAGCMLISTKFNSEVFVRFREYCNSPINIGNNVQIGAGSIILAGVSVCDNVIVGAGSVVSKSIEIPGVYVGAPVTQIRSFENK